MQTVPYLHIYLVPEYLAKYFIKNEFIDNYQFNGVINYCA